MSDNTVRCIRKRDRDYPLRMIELSGMPECLYVKGNLPDEEKPSIAIVGARSCSNYGRNLAGEFSRIFSEEGIQVISGLALGIDGEAHGGALRGNTPTFAILANDVDVCYPKSNQKIYSRILEGGGGIISEQPPGTPPVPCYFPARNRIISALCDIILIIEAKLKSGSLITADFALEQGKSVYALPGRVGDLLSEGCNRLIYQGAGIAYTPDVILQELKPGSKFMADNLNQRKLAKMSREVQYIYNQLDQTPISMEDLCRRVPYEIPSVLSALTEMQMNGLVVEIGKNYYIKSTIVCL